MKYTKIYNKNKGYYLGWIKEIPGINTQGKTLKETKENLEEAFSLILKTKHDLPLVFKNDIKNT
ncbi:MAG: type II toxin-antitoxin system HicB family antitoxin [Candidatus Paceibacterota bacterium]|jgi:predicted RNase H-like HicB family nuclease